MLGEREKQQQIELWKKQVLHRVESDEVNSAYFTKLIDLYWREQVGDERHLLKLVTSKESYHPSNDKNKFTLVYPTAVMTEEMLNCFPYVLYSSLLEKKENKKNKISLWLRPMQAGVGSTIERETHLHKYDEQRASVGSKGTDLFIPHPDGDGVVSLAEMQLLRAISLAERNIYERIYFQDVVGPETLSAVGEIWQKKNTKYQTSYKEIFSKTDELVHLSRPVFQHYFPTVSLEGDLSFERMAPGGHGLFLFDLFYSIIHREIPLLDDEKNNNIIIVLSNGEDLTAFPDETITNYMIEEEIPVVMLTTDKTVIDTKGGQLALFEEKNRSYLGILEKAQADMSVNGEFFGELGLRPGDSRSLFNTNTILVNYALLANKLDDFVDRFGLNGLWENITPQLIKNKKGDFFQLEMAMGSVLLDLDKVWREHFEEHLVTIINIDSTFRSQFFAPIKKAFDFYHLYYSDDYIFDKNDFRPINENRKDFLQVSFKSPFYDDVENTLQAFHQASVKKLVSLSVEKGEVNFSHLKLEGRLKVTSLFPGVVFLKEKLEGPEVLKNLSIFIDEEGKVSLESL